MTETYCIMNTGELVVGRREAIDAAFKAEPHLKGAYLGEGDYVKGLIRRFLEGPPPPFGHVAGAAVSIIRVKP